MMGRLFWKIFLWFLAVLLLLIAAMLWSLRFNNTTQSDSDTLLNRSFNQRLDAVAAIMQHGGPDAVRDFLRNSTQTPLRIWVLDQNDEELLGRRFPLRLSLADLSQIISRKIEDKSGKEYRLIIRRPRILEQRLSGATNASSHTAWAPLLIILFSSALACAWLAWYISRPVRLMRTAVRSLTAGENKEPITEKLGRRRDELTELAVEFDKMAKVIDANQQALRQLLHDVSHELRSPLTRLRLQVGLLEQSGEGKDPEQLARMDRNLTRLDDLINQVLTMARMEAGDHYQLADYVDITVLLRELIDDIRIEAEAKGCRLTTAIPPDERIIPANQELLRRALENVLRNAVYHTPPGQPISAELTVQAEYCEIRIRDKGPGIDPDKLARIFQPFFRVDDARNPTKGFGLGLAIAQRAIRIHRGDVTANNLTDGGLEMVIRIPVS